MTDAATKITSKQATMIAALLIGKRIEDAAAVAKVSERTAYRWLREPVFQAELAAARRQVIGSSLDILTAGARLAAGVLVEVCNDRLKPASVRVRAASELLDRLHKWVEFEDLAARIAALEEKHAANDK
jgi:hypothetical protein